MGWIGRTWGEFRDDMILDLLLLLFALKLKLKRCHD